MVQALSAILKDQLLIHLMEKYLKSFFKVKNIIILYIISVFINTYDYVYNYIYNYLILNLLDNYSLFYLINDDSMRNHFVLMD